MRAIIKRKILRKWLLVFSVAFVGLAFSQRIDSSARRIRKRVETPPTSDQPDHGVSDYVFSVKTGLPHRFPEGAVRGLWLSSVPLKRDVFAFPKGFEEKFAVLEEWATQKKDTPYHIGKTPLLVNLKNGAYEILFVQPDLTEKERIRYAMRKDKPSRKKSRLFGPFLIAPKEAVTYAFWGDCYCTQTVRVRVSNNVNASIVLFQWENQKTSEVLAEIPLEDNFRFGSLNTLRDPNRLGLLDEERIPFSLTDEQVSEAENMLKRAGIWAKNLDDNHSIRVEVKPNNTDVFTVICAMRKGGLLRFLKKRMAHEDVSRVLERLKEGRTWRKAFHRNQTTTVEAKSKNIYVATLTSVMRE